MKESIALLANDIHVSKDNINEFESNWDELLSICEREDIDEVVIGGDMFTSRSSQTLATLLSVKNALDKAAQKNIYVTIAEGNHDKVDQESIFGYNHIWKGLSHVDVVDSHRAMFWDGCDFELLVMSYFPENGSFLERLETAVNDVLAKSNVAKSKSDIILYIHEGVHGALGDFEIEGELPQKPLLGFKAVLCGHYHNRVRIKGTNIEYIGSSRQNNFGEDEEKGYTILYSDGSYAFVKNNINTRYQTVEVKADEVKDIQLAKDDRYKYKIKVECDDKQAKMIDKQKLLDLGFHKVELVAKCALSKESASVDIQAKYDRQGITKEYLNYCSENSIDNKLGLKYLGV